MKIKIKNNDDLSNEFYNFSKLVNKIDNMNLNDDESLNVIYIVVSNIIEKNEKNIDTIQELVNIIREVINEIDRKEQKTPEMIKLKKILLKYKDEK